MPKTLSPEATARRLNDATADLMLRYPQMPLARAYRLAMERDTALARAHHAGDDGMAPTAPPAPAAGQLPAGTIDPGAELQNHAAALGISFSESCRRFPALYAAYNRAEYVTTTTAPAAPQRPERRHYSALSEAERRHWLPMGSVRRLRPGERPGPRETMFATFAPSDPGAKFAEVTA